MTARRVAAVLAAAALAGPVLAQSLGEIAARDRQRREAQRTAGAPSYTDADLKAPASPSASPSPSPSPTPISWTNTPPRPQGGWRSSPRPPSPAAPRAGSSPTPAPVPLPTPDVSAQQRAALEARWRAIATQRRDALAAAEARVVALQSQLAAAQNDLEPVNLGDPNREQSRRARIGDLQRELEAAQAEAARARQAVDDLEDDARRAGALPGWVR